MNGNVIKHYEDVLTATMFGWPSFSPTTYVILLASLGVLGLHFVALLRSATWGDRLSAMALNRLTEELVGHIKESGSLPFRNRVGDIDPALLRQLVLRVQREVRSPALTTPMASEALRRATMEARRFEPVTLTLDNVMKAYDPTGARLLSIAHFNRMLAYVISALSFGIVIVLAQFALTWLPGNAGLRLITVLFGALVALVLLDIRALQYWRRQYRRPTSAHVAPIRGSAPGWIPDFFLAFAHSNNEFVVSVLFGPIWEGFIQFFGLALPFVGVWITVQVGRYLHWVPASAHDIIAIEFAILLVIGFVWIGVWQLTQWHEYKYWEVRRLRRRLAGLNKAMALYQVGVRPLPPHFLVTYTAICDDLWAITDLTYYLERADAVRKQL